MADKSFSAEQVAKHKTEADCWIIIHGQVYDVTKFLDDHPGGPDIIADGAGTDLTDQFEDTGHSAEARADLKKYHVGSLEGAPKSAASKAAKAPPSNGGGSGATTTSNSSVNPFLIAGLVLVVAIGAFILLNP